MGGGKNELGFEMFYYFLQCTKAKQVQLLHEVKNRVLSLDQDITTVRKRLEEATGIGVYDHSTGFNAKQEYFATAGVSKRIKIYDIQNVLEDRFRIPCPILELTWRSKLSDLDWSKHENAHLATSDYDGMISVWDIDSG